MVYLLAIDPGTNSTGLALFQDDKLITAGSVHASATAERYIRTKVILNQLLAYSSGYGFKRTHETKQILACEEPVTKGHASVALNRLLGGIEALFENKPLYIAPTAVKKAMGKGTLDKKEVKLAALTILTEDERAVLISGDDYDMYDAIAIGLTALGRHAPAASKEGKGKSMAGKACKGRKKRSRTSRRGY